MISKKEYVEQQVEYLGRSKIYKSNINRLF
jgi:hypothetical protein